MVASEVQYESSTGDVRQRASATPKARNQQQQHELVQSAVDSELSEQDKRALEKALDACRSQGRAVVLYDGLCNVCNASIRFTLSRVGKFEEEVSGLKARKRRP
jgi:hypothetical protein